ncbi:hypothetical protein SPHINGO391_500096 [Sphingomonas aurantiaca]|uniref:Coenzyme Q-binding protein COQ10 START domain-containing protein n=1 Tax=Sphingomonas aurantiaca TaxID=185949 RepID=A0A5E8A8Z3_9SPHN|nr:hypothetical protein SPHINGO391_500096 [Sphingomonas aurantiaca]
MTINRPVGEVFAYSRDFANLPRFMEYVERIDILSDTRSLLFAAICYNCFKPAAARSPGISAI